MNQKQVQEKTLKVIIVGKTNVGKSALLLRYIDGQYAPQKMTIGIDYRFKKVSYQGKQFNLELWDTAGQQKYHNIVHRYFTLSKAVCIVFDITNKQTLNDAKIWLQKVVLYCGNQIPKVLLANKSDLLDDSKLEETLKSIGPQIDSLKNEYNFKLFVVSACSGQNINQAFDYLIQQFFLRNTLQSNKKSGFAIKSSETLFIQRKKKKSCC